MRSCRWPFSGRGLSKRPLSILPFELVYGRLVLTPGFSPTPLPLSDHLLIPLLCHLRSLLCSLLTTAYPGRGPTPVCPQSTSGSSFSALGTNVPHPFPVDGGGGGALTVILVTLTTTKLEASLIGFTYPTSSPFLLLKTISFPIHQPQEDPVP